MTVSVASASSAYEIRINGVADQDGVVPLAVGAGNVIAVVVTAQDGGSSQTYTVMVTRAGSSEASLSGLSSSGDGGKVFALSPAFAAVTTDYTATVDHDVSAATVTVSVVSAGSAYEIRLNGVVDQDGVVPLAVGSGNVIAVVMTAQDGDELADVHGDGNAGWVGRCEPECAVAEWGDVDAGVCVGDCDVHGVGGDQRDGDDGVGDGGCWGGV